MWLCLIPFVKPYIKKRIADGIKFFFKGVIRTGINVTRTITKEGLKQAQVLKRLQEFADFELFLKNKGKYSGSIYSTSDELIQLNGEASNMFLFSDLNHLETNSMARQLENEIVSMMLSMYKGNDRCSGMTTRGGSESIEMAILGHRQYYRRTKGITQPEIVVCETALAAMLKACDFFGIKYIRVPITKDYEVDVDGMEKAITANTIMIIMSCPNFPYGTCDPFKKIAQIALKYDIGFHLDSCMGGFLVPFAKEHNAGLPEDEYNFTVDGLTSLTADPHKYGLSAKGIGVLLFGRKEIQEALYFCKADGPGPIYATSTVQDTRSAAVIAACWATMMYYGQDGYSKLAKGIFDESTYFINGLKKIPGIDVIGNPIVSL
jgi:sphinganine-1-phosphate aldolase